MLKGFFLLLVVGISHLQYQVWFGDSGYFAKESMVQEREEIENKLLVLKAKNRLIRNQIGELRRSPDAIESHARTRLGMIMPGELFFIAPEEGS